MAQDDGSDTRGYQNGRPQDVGHFASTVISVLRDRQTVTGTGVRQFVIDHLMRAILSTGSFDPVMMLEELRGHRLSVDAVIDTYIPCAARALGVLWVEDTISFAAVTIGSLRLQALLGEASCETRMELRKDLALLDVLVVVPQDEQHFLGASVVSAQLRRMGCEVATSFDEPLGSLGARVKKDRPDLVLITCSSSQKLEGVTQTVQSIRNGASKNPVIALGGALSVDPKAAKEQTGVDMVTNIARDAVAFCAKRTRSPSQS
jgi:methanogenic corrinoid protein MtbC1